MKVVAALIFIAAVSIALICCNGPAGRSGVKFKQYYLKGEQLYLQHCSNCHQKDGRGLARLYPPLDSSDFMLKYPDDVLCLIRNGRSGELVVNGVVFNQPMPSFPSLSDLEIAQIATYIYNSWSNERGIFEVKDVSLNRSQCEND